MAPKTKPAPQVVPYMPPSSPGVSSNEPARWIRAFEVQDQSWKTRLNIKLAELESHIVPDPPGPDPEPSPGARDNHWHFPNPAAGMVLIGRTNATQWRLWIDDESANEDNPLLDNPEIRFESGGTVVYGDVRFNSALSGPVIRGRFRDAVYRIYMQDEEAGAEHVQFEKILASEVNAGDMEFGVPGVSFVNFGRTFGHRWEWFINNESGDLFTDAHLIVGRFDG